MLVFMNIIDTLSVKYNNVEVSLRKGYTPGWYRVHITASLDADAYGAATEFSGDLSTDVREALVLEAAEVLDKQLRRRNGKL